MACLETDFLVDLLRKKSEAISKLEKLQSAGAVLSVTPVTLTELFSGGFKSKREENIEQIEKMAFTLVLLSYDFFAAKEAGKLLGFLEKNGEKIGEMDTLTGAIALRHGEKLITRNTKHFKKIKGLEIETY